MDRVFSDWLSDEMSLNISAEHHIEYGFNAIEWVKMKSDKTRELVNLEKVCMQLNYCERTVYSYSDLNLSIWEMP